MALTYAMIEGANPVVYDKGKYKSWVCWVGDGAWTKMNFAETLLQAHHQMSKAEFEKEFPGLPPLPSEAAS